jgi:RNA polymerase sigma-70 factor, ECF subfamily
MNDNELIELIYAAQSGDKISYDLFLRNLLPHLKGIVSSTTKGSLPFEDVIQEALIAIHKALPTYVYPRSVLKWAKIITRHKAIDMLRSSARYRLNEHEYDEQVIKDFSVIKDPEDAVALKDALSLLDEEERKLLFAVKIEGRRYNELCMVFNEQESTLKVRVHRTIKKLRGILALQHYERFLILFFVFFK